MMMQKEIFEKQVKGWEKVEGAKIDSVPFSLVTVQHPKGGYNLKGKKPIPNPSEKGQDNLP